MPNGGLYDAHDEWGISPNHFEIVPPSERVTNGRSLKQTRSMPFHATRQAPDEFAPAVPSSRPPPTSRHTRKNSKVAQILCLEGTLDKARDAVNVADSISIQGLMSPPILPMEVDPFTGPPLGATIVGNVGPTIQMHPPAPQHTFRPMVSMPSLSAPADHHATHVHAPRAHAPRSTTNLRDTTARRAPRPLHRAGYTSFGTLPSRSLSNPPPALPSQPLQPSRIVNIESKTRYGLTSAHTAHTGGTFAPLVRDTAVTLRGRHHNMYDQTSTVVPTLRKARSSVVLSNKPPPPLYAPKPVKALAGSSAETLHNWVESSSATPSHSDNVRNRVTGGSAHAVWPPAPVLRPQRIATPEQDAYRSAAIEAGKTRRKIKEEGALLESVLNVGEHEAPRRGADSEPQRPQRSRHHRRAATEGRVKRVVEYHTLPDLGYDLTDQKWKGGW